MVTYHSAKVEYLRIDIPLKIYYLKFHFMRSTLILIIILDWDWYWIWVILVRNLNILVCCRVVILIVLIS